MNNPDAHHLDPDIPHASPAEDPSVQSPETSLISTCGDTDAQQDENSYASDEQQISEPSSNSAQQVIADDGAEKNLWIQAFPDLWTILLAIFKGRVLSALEKGQRNNKYWIVALSLTVVVSALILSLQMMYGLGAIGQLIPFGSVFGVSERVSSAAFSMFFVALLAAIVVIFARITALWLVFKIRAKAIHYSDAASVCAVAFTPMLCVMLIMAVLSLFPLFFLSMFTIFIGIVLLPPCFLIAELVLYIGVNRAAEFEKSILIPHVLLTGAAGAVSGLVMYIFFSIMG